METTKDKRVEVIGVGPPKTATTWVADILRDHPQVYVPIEKELHYFNPFQHYHRDVPNRNAAQPPAWYHAFFKEASPELVWAEFTVSYFEFSGCAQAIFDYNPEAKIIISLREPVARAFSHFLFLQNRGVIGPEDFELHVARDPYVLEVSTYANRLEEYLSVFPQDQVLVLLHEDLKKDAQAFYRSIADFLDLDKDVEVDLERVSNAATKVKSHKVNQAYMRLRDFMHRYKLHGILDFSQKIGLTRFLEWIRDDLNMSPNTKAPKMPQELKAKYSSRFAEDKKRVEALLNRTLNEWD
ncbi:sulfotransferase [Cryomorphaceae bacterium]|nr:sulfotransferase [Cryomorphaceae bacterium]